MVEGIYLMGIFQGVVLSSLLGLHPKFRTLPNRWLSGLVGVTTLLITGDLLVWSEAAEDEPYLLLVASGTPFLIGPFLWIYIRQRLIQPVHHVAYHFIPALTYYVFLMYVILDTTHGDVNLFVSGNVLPAHQSARMTSIAFLKGFHMIVYTGLSFYTILKQSQRSWLLLNLLVLLLVSQIVFWVFVFFRLPYIDSVFTGFQILSLYLIGYTGLVHTDELIRRKLRYASTRLSKNEVDSHFKTLYERIENEEYFLDKQLTLRKLSEHLGWTEHFLSEIINRSGYSNYSDFINGFRVERVKKLLNSVEHQKLTLLAIGYEAGFANKNSFNVHFKRLVGQTPSQFRDSLKS